MPSRVPAAGVAAAELSKTTDSWPSDKLGTARALAAQAQAKAHVLAGAPLSSRLSWAAVRCSGILHSSSLGRWEANRQTAEPARGCS